MRIWYVALTENYLPFMVMKDQRIVGTLRESYEKGRRQLATPLYISTEERSL